MWGENLKRSIFHVDFRTAKKLKKCTNKNINKMWRKYAFLSLFWCIFLKFFNGFCICINFRGSVSFIFLQRPNLLYPITHITWIICTYTISLYKDTLLLNATCWWWHLCFGNDHLDHHKLEMTRPCLTPFPRPYPPFPYPSLNSCPHHSHLFYSCLLSFFLLIFYTFIPLALLLVAVPYSHFYL
jgi:hypothetical protein